MFRYGGESADENPHVTQITLKCHLKQISVQFAEHIQLHLNQTIIQQYTNPSASLPLLPVCQLLMVIGFVIYYAESPVKLFCKNHPDHLVRKGHFRQ